MFYIQPTSEGKSFNTTTDLVNIADLNEKPFVLFNNPANSNTNIMIVNIAVGSSAVDNLKTIVKVYQNPTVSNSGTLLTSTNMRIGSSITPVCSIYKIPTITSNGTLKFTRTINISSSFNGIHQAIIIEPGNSILITLQNTSITEVNIHTDVNWLEGV